MREFFLSIVCLLGSISVNATGPDSTFRIFTENNMQGLTGADGKIVIPAKYEELGWSSGPDEVIGEIIGYRMGNKWGLLSTSDEVLISSRYNQLYYLNEALLIAALPEKFYNRDLFGVIDLKNRTIIPFQYHSVEGAGKNYITSMVKEGVYNYGLLNEKGEILLPFRFDAIKAIDPALLSVRNREKKYALYQVNGKPLTGFNYDFLTSWNGYIQTEQYGKKGLLNRNGSEFKPCIYKDLRIENGKLTVLEFPEWKALTAKNQEIHKIQYDSLQVFDGGLVVYANGYKSILDTDYNFAETDSLHFSIHYDTLFRQDNLMFAGHRTDSGFNWNIYNHDGKKVSQKEYQEIGRLSEDMIPVKNKGFWGYIDKKGYEIILQSYQWVSEFRNGLAIVKFHDQFGLINNDGEWVNLPRYHSITFVNDRSYIYTRNLSYGILYGYNEVVYRTGNRLQPFNGRVLETDQEGQYGLVDLNGKVIFHTDYDSIIFSRESNHFILERNGNFILHDISASKEFRLEKSITDVYQPTEGYFGIMADKKFGFVDYEGKLRISNRYDSIQPVKNGLIPFMLRGKWGLIDLSERIVVQPLYDRVDPINDFNIIVKNKKGYGLLDRTGKVIINPEFEDIHALERGDLRVRRNSKYGILDREGRVLVNTMYEAIETISGEYYRVRRKEKYGLINSSGVATIPPVYDGIIYNSFSGIYYARTDKNWQ